jgi:hypothetical protein
MKLIITPDDSGTDRGSGYATVPYSSDSEDETVVETTEDDLAVIFENAKASGGTLDGADASIDSAVDDPLSYIDYLILDSNDAIVFDPDYVREDPTSTST